MKTSLAAVLCLGAAAVISAPDASANLIYNGSFEIGAPASTTPWTRLAPGSTALQGWTVGGVGTNTVRGVDWHNGAFNPGPAQSGSWMVDLNIDGTGGQGAGQGTISQAFATVAGTYYSLSFWLAGPRSSEAGGTLNPRTVIVGLAGSTTQTQTFTAPDAVSTSLVWYQRNFDFIADSASTTLTFSPLAGTGANGYWGAFIDNVSVNTAVVPLPAPILLLGSGLLGLCCFGRARRRA